MQYYLEDATTLEKVAEKKKIERVSKKAKIRTAE